MKRWIIPFAGLIVGTLALAVFRVHITTTTARLERFVKPGKLSAGHAFLEEKCSSCHTPNTGIEAANCIVCHANSDNLLQRQPTAFHANIDRCADCHTEHQGSSVRSVNMDHTALARIGLKMLKSLPSDSESAAVAGQIESRLMRPGAGAALASALNCAGCHAAQDPHFGLFGRACNECHVTERWTIAGYRHPSARSLDCAQCHQAPPSHYMEHFRMISMKVAGVENAQVSECYRCHKTTSWNDIRGVGFYKHH